jgi:predicted O-methyltransferase YrrM
MHFINRIINYSKFYFDAQGLRGFGIHSPFVFDLVTKIIRKNKPMAFYEEIEKQRRTLLKNKSIIHVTEMGSGSYKKSGNQRVVNEIASTSLKPKRQAQLLCRLIDHFQCKNIIEIGTSLGITACYLAKANPSSLVTTLEGCPEISKIAQNTFNQLHINNINIVTGEFNQTLPRTIAGIENIDFVFFDGNHRLEPTLAYFKECLQKKHNDSLFVFDDHHKSPEMENAWEEIKNHPEVKVTIDLYFLGLVFFKKELTKQHFKIRF